MKLKELPNARGPVHFRAGQGEASEFWSGVSGVVALPTRWRAAQHSAMQHQFKPARNYRQFGTWRRACLPGDLKLIMSISYVRKEGL
jgi:hypothetical protein